MKNAIRSIAIVAAAALSLPVLAAEPSSIAGDPTWPAIENPAPAVALNGAEAPAPVDITQIEIVGNAPAIALVPHQAEATQPQLAAPVPPAQAHVALGSVPAHVAAAQ